jgi:hypothetical protein
MRKLTAALLLTLSVTVTASIALAQFIQPKVYNVPSGFLNSMLAKGDFNGDGKLDVLFAAGGPSVNELAVFPGNGTGGFTAPILTPITANQGSVVTAGDVNGDGIPDVIITAVDAITAQTEIGVMLADGTGKFGAAILFHTTMVGTFVLGDFTGDEKTDLAVLGDPVTVFPGNGEGTFGAPIASSFNYAAACAAVADFNKDGKLDLTTGGAVLLGNGNGTFQSPLTVTGGGCGVAVGDFNKDGIPDLVTGGGKVGGAGVLIFLGNGTGKFTTGTLYKTSEKGSSGFVVDSFNADSNPDIAVSNGPDDDVTILLGNGTGKFTIGKTYALSDRNILSGDFNGDHKADLAVFSNHGFSVLLGNGTGGLIAELAQNFQPGQTIHLADFNGDGKIDAYEFSDIDQPSAVVLGNGAGGFGAPISVPSSCQGGTGVIVDFNGDKKPDVALIVGGGGGGVGVCLGNGDGTFQTAIVSDTGVQHSGLIFGDFNRDGKMDLAATDSGGLSILLGHGDGTFKSAILIALSNIVYTATGDFNHDGKLDIAAMVNTPDGLEIAVLLGNGDGTFKSPATTPVPNAVPPFVVGDLNGDGIPDIVTPGLYILIGNGDGTFQTPVFHKLFGVTTLQLRDINNDGKLDVIAVAESNGFFDVLLGNGDGTFQTTKNYSALLGRVALGVADLNGDGKLDVAYLRATENEKTSTLEVFLNGH